MRGLSPLLALAAGLLVAAPAVAADHLVTFAPYAYSDPDLVVTGGDTVTFSGTFANHPLVWIGGDFATKSDGTSQQFAFPRPGTYAYYCLLHGDSRGMRGTVRVPGDQHPARVSFAASPAAPQPGEPVTFTYTGDPDPDGTLVRWQWDLDGDGSLETATTTPSATHTYASAGAVTVRVQAVDDGHEGSAVAEQVLTVALPAASAPAAATSDTTAPRATLVKLTGLKLRFHTSERATATATLRAGAQDHRARDRQGRGDHDPPAPHRRRPRPPAARAQAPGHADAHVARCERQCPHPHAPVDGGALVAVRGRGARDRRPLRARTPIA